MMKEYQDYIEQVLAHIDATPETKKQIRESLSEQIEVMIEKYGSLAIKYLDSPEQVAQEFNDNLAPEQRELPHKDLYPWMGRRYPYRKISKIKVFNLPLYHISDGYNPSTGRFEIAKGFFAIGPFALGIFAFGGLSAGIISFGGLSLGLLIAIGGGAFSSGIAIGGLAVGGLLALGGGAFSFGMALGGYAKGYIAIGEEPIGRYIYNTTTGEGNAIEWFRRHLPYFTKYFS